MKALIRTVTFKDITYPCLMFCCPGCGESDDNTGLHLLAVNTDLHSPSWSFDGNLEAPTLNPSILSKTGKDLERVCHSFLKVGIFEFLDDCTHSMRGTRVPMLDLPEWVIE